MQVVGIVAEYNPFHTGHAYQISRSRALVSSEETAVVAVMSGNWVQQANCACADKWTRTRLALLGGVDLVLELPTVWATASAERFALGAVELLHRTGIVTHLSFGSECGDLSSLMEAANALAHPDYPSLLRQFLKDGNCSFPVARQRAVETLLGAENGLLSYANNNLGIEYLRALMALHSPIQPLTVQRMGAGHNTITGTTPLPFVSATQIRAWFQEGNYTSAAAYLCSNPYPTLSRPLPNLHQVERGILAKLRTMTESDWAALPDSGQAEGLPARLTRAGRQAISLEDFFTRCATRRYTNARLRRLLLWAYLGLTAADFPSSPSYLRILGATARGHTLLRQMKQTTSLPILTKPAHVRTLSPEAQTLFGLEVRCTDLYDLCLSSPPLPGREWTTGPVRIEEELPQ